MIFFFLEDYKASINIEINKWQKLFGVGLLESSKLEYLYSYTSEKYDLLALPLNNLNDARRVILCLEDIETNLIDLDNDIEYTFNLYVLLIENKVSILPEDERQLNLLADQYKKLNTKVILATQYIIAAINYYYYVLF